MSQYPGLTVGDLIILFYGQFLAMFKDEKLASVATATAINDLLADAADVGTEAAA